MEAGARWGELREVKVWFMHAGIAPSRASVSTTSVWFEPKVDIPFVILPYATTINSSEGPNRNMQHTGLVEQLSQLKPGKLPQPVFEAVAKLIVTPTFVVVPLFKRRGETRIVLTRRAANDSHYSGMLHPPGKIFSSTDRDLDDVFARLVSTELQLLDVRAAPVFVTHFFEEITRGRELSLVHYLEVPDPSDIVPSYSPLDLPEDVVATDVPRIHAAVDAFDKV